jgi:hypothetical protein
LAHEGPVPHKGTKLHIQKVTEVFDSLFVQKLFELPDRLFTRLGGKSRRPLMTCNRVRYMRPITPVAEVTLTIQPK